MTTAWTHIEERLRAVAAEGEVAWPALQLAVYDELLRLARFQPIGRLREDVDAAAEVAVRALGRMRANDFRAVRRLFDPAGEPPSITAWVRVLVRSCAIDVMREHAEFVRGGHAGDGPRREGPKGGRWISLVTLVTRPAAPDDSLAEMRRDVERFVEASVNRVHDAVATRGEDAACAELAAEWTVQPLHVRRLVNKGALYLPALRLVLAGFAHAEVASKLGVSRREVELLVRAIEELLAARRFARERSSPASRRGL